MAKVLDAESPIAAAMQPSSAVIWSARVLSWLCWLAIVGVTLAGVLARLKIIPIQDIDAPLSGDTLIVLSAHLHDTAAQAAAMEAIQSDTLYNIAGLVPLGLFIWALYSAQRSLAGVARGDYFGRPTATGLRNLGLAVLLYNTIAPVVTVIPKVLYLIRVKGKLIADLDVNLMFTQPIAMMLVFAGTVTLISAVMAHAARLEDENRSFV